MCLIEVPLQRLDVINDFCDKEWCLRMVREVTFLFQTKRKSVKKILEHIISNIYEHCNWDLV